MRGAWGGRVSGAGFRGLTESRSWREGRGDSGNQRHTWAVEQPQERVQSERVQSERVQSEARTRRGYGHRRRDGGSLFHKLLVAIDAHDEAAVLLELTHLGSAPADDGIACAQARNMHA